MIRAAGFELLPLMEMALRSRAHADELLLASRAARMNAEFLETIICEGTDEEVRDALRLCTTAAVVPYTSDPNAS
jgi:hypothetical protein